MNLIELLQFIPLGIGAFLAYHLIMKVNLPDKNLTKILTYFLGVVIVFVAIGWLVRSFIVSWANDLLQIGTTSGELQQLIDTSENIVNNALGTGGDDSGGGATPVSGDNTLIIVVTPTPSAGQQLVPSQPGVIAGQHTVVTGDSLYSIAQIYGTTVDAIMLANGLNSYLIYPGQVLQIPAP